MAFSRHDKLYVVISVNDEGLRDALITRAPNMREAIKNINLYPFVWPADWDDPDTPYEKALDRVVAYYGGPEGDLKKASYEGNFVDGDSSCQNVLIEIDPRYHDLRTYPKTQLEGGV